MVWHLGAVNEGGRTSSDVIKHPTREQGGLGAIRRTKLRLHVEDVDTCGLRGNPELGGNLRIRATRSEEPEYLSLARGQGFVRGPQLDRLSLSTDIDYRGDHCDKSLAIGPGSGAPLAGLDRRT
jgi:hypothetical protein